MSAREARIAAQRAAHALLSSLRVGQEVDLTKDGRTYRMTVSQPLRRADFALEPGTGRVVEAGSWESARVTVTLGPGRYSCEVTVDQLAGTLAWGKVELVPIAPCSDCAGRGGVESDGHPCPSCLGTGGLPGRTSR